MNEPNPDWVSAPYEESGIGDITLLCLTIDSLAHRFPVLAIKVERQGKRFAWNIRESSPDFTPFNESAS